MRIKKKNNRLICRLIGIAKACLNGAGHKWNILNKPLLTTASSNPPTFISCISSLSPSSTPSTLASSFCVWLFYHSDELKLWASGKEFILHVILIQLSMKHSYKRKTTVSASLLFTCGIDYAFYYHRIYHPISSIFFVLTFLLYTTAHSTQQLWLYLFLHKPISHYYRGSCRNGPNKINANNISVLKTIFYILHWLPKSLTPLKIWIWSHTCRRETEDKEREEETKWSSDIVSEAK